ncbi:asparaginase [Bacillus solimangrovi]|uniref:asparaginase n=1 Tax=Bacillus solimangrovi TaxID=1305675 RepID=A0A1E5LHC7_9BACI|nr:asparaginase [Bacillus solimangrovi]OEH93480.1 L-asparaginase [Bacillus solimangrovi]
MKNILILHTGGTISMEEDNTTGAVKVSGKHPLDNTLPSVSSLANITNEELFKLPSPHMTPANMLMLAKHIEKKVTQEQVEGVVITHGTDTLEETAYLLDLCLKVDIPVVVTGAMRSSNEIGSDGPYNLISSVKVAACDTAKNKGVLVVLNDEIHTAKNVTKTHTSNVATFQSPQYGPIGLVTKRGINFHHMPINRDRYPVSHLSKNVILLKAYAGMDATTLNMLSSLAVDGVVIEALGQGNMPPATLPAIENLLKNNVPVVLVSRCFNGIVQDIYGYEGGGRPLKKMGVIFSNGLNGQKARLKLMVTLELTTDHHELQEMFLK